jgi:hypothetical protein
VRLSQVKNTCIAVIGILKRPAAFGFSGVIPYYIWEGSLVMLHLDFVPVSEERLSCSLKLAQGGQESMFPSRYVFIMFIYYYFV